ncbi:LOW QUALITY PROTEIN: proton-coupled folate transporter-like [Panulirus ornatus]|uniref:LOW QUALITY PROTEIN: proton-coupled folate transporter-like n=1 Tax=Panulirus ornatus TaxID=150431 RepID=UPI003A8610CF
MADRREEPAKRNGVREFVSNITIEPMLFLKEVGRYNMTVIRENLKLERFCLVRLNHTAEDCAVMNDGDHTDLQVEVQRLDTVFIFYENLVNMIIPILLTAFIASWSDRRGRRAPLCLSLLGEACYAGIYFLVAFFPSCPPEVLLLGSFCRSLGGGWVLFLMAAYGYIADKSSSQSRTLRLTVMTAIWKLGGPGGTVLGAWLYDVGGYLWVFGLSCLICIICLTYTAIVVKEKVQPAQEDPSVKALSPWNPRNVIDLFRVCFKKRRGRGRLQIITLMAMMLFFFSCGAHNMYLWALRVLNWDQDKYSLFSTTDQLAHEVVMLLLAPIVRYLGIHDCLVGAGSSLLYVLRLLAFGLITRRDQWWVLYMFVIIPGSFPAVVIRSLMSKLCQEDEVGRIFSLLAILEVFWSVVDGAIYAAIYSATIDFYPSYEHLVGAYFGFLVFSGFLGIRLSLDSDGNDVMVPPGEKSRGKRDDKEAAQSV